MRLVIFNLPHPFDRMEMDLLTPLQKWKQSWVPLRMPQENKMVIEVRNCHHIIILKTYNIGTFHMLTHFHRFLSLCCLIIFCFSSIFCLYSTCSFSSLFVCLLGRATMMVTSKVFQHGCCLMLSALLGRRLSEHETLC